MSREKNLFLLFYCLLDVTAAVRVIFKPLLSRCLVGTGLKLWVKAITVCLCLFWQP